MTFGWTILLAGGLALALTMTWQCVLTPWLRRFHDGDASLGFLFHLSNVWCRLIHRVRFEGLEHLHAAGSDRPLLFVGNHTCGIDPLLVMAVPRRLSRMVYWLMARDMMLGALDDVWRVSRVLPVDRTRADSTSLRRALRLLKSGECVGIFAEGRITRPRGSIRPFMDGVGMLATRGGATVVPVLIDGTPDTDSIAVGVFWPSRSRVRFLEPIRFDRTTSPQEASNILRQRLVDASGWPAVDEIMPLQIGDG
jgi:1-acyl-sn-glycerol-3-phosphate acyltransferase